MEVLQKIEAIPVQDPNAGLSGQQPSRAVYINKVTIRASKS
jgi:hypothetical protein